MTYIIAEISGNHGGHLHKALELIEAANDAGASAVKFQLYKPEDLPDFDPKSNFPVPVSWLEPMFQLAEDVGAELFASVFAPWAVEVLKPFEPVYYKIASPESTCLPDYGPLVEAIRATDTPILRSFGKSYFRELDDTLLYCKQGYPASLETEDFYHIRDYGGFSDHTVGIIGTLAAIQAGAEIIEKHFKVDDDCIDTAFSINPKELKALCDLSL